jgi:outer membrane protein
MIIGSAGIPQPQTRDGKEDSKLTNSTAARAGRLISVTIALLILATTWALAADFGKLTLFDGLRLVTEENRLIHITRQDEAISQADTLVARSGLLPKVNASYTQNETDVQPGVRIGPQSFSTAEKTFYTYSLALQQILYDFRGISSQYEASKKVLETRQFETKRVRNSVALQFTVTYLDLLEGVKIVAVAQKEKERLETHLKTAQDLYKEGAITKNDLLQAQVRLADARQKLLTAENLTRIHRSRLNNMLARPLDARFETEDVTRPFDTRFELDRAFEEAEKERYEVKIVDATLDATKLQEISRRSEYLPRFFAEGRYDYMKNTFQAYEGIWTLTVGMNINLLSGGSTKAELSKLASRAVKLSAERKKLIDDIRLEVEKYYLEMVNAADRIKVTRDAIAQAEENLKINNVRYAEGVGTATDTIDAITLLTGAESNYYRSLYEFYRSEAGLLYAMGKDLLEVYR